MARPKPITLTHIDEADFDGPYAPQPFVAVGDVPFQPAIEPVEFDGFTPVPASFADEDAVQAYLETLVGELGDLVAVLADAGIIAD